MFVILHFYRKTWEATFYFEHILARHTSGFSISDINVFTHPPYGYCSCEGSEESRKLCDIWSYFTIYVYYCFYAICFYSVNIFGIPNMCTAI